MVAAVLMRKQTLKLLRQNVLHCLSAFVNRDSFVSQVRKQTFKLLSQNVLHCLSAFVNRDSFVSLLVTMRFIPITVSVGISVPPSLCV